MNDASAAHLDAGRGEGVRELAMRADAAPADGWTPAALTAAAAVALGQALVINNGGYDPVAIAGLALSFVLLACALGGRALPALERGGAGLVVAIMGVGALAQFAEHAALRPAAYLAFEHPRSAPFLVGVALAAVLTGSALSPRSWLGRAHLPVLLAIYFALGVWIIHASPRPHIDVHTFHLEAIDALLSGKNPYAITMRYIYDGGGPYRPDLVANGRVLHGYPYPPLLLLLALPGHVLGGDHRYGELVAMTLSAALMAYARPGRLATLAATLFLFMPRTFHLLENAWTEPYVILLLSAVLWCAMRGSRLLVVALGLFLAVKQYGVFLLPPLGLLLPRAWPARRLARLLAGAVAVAAAVTLPLVLWDLRACLHSLLAPGAGGVRLDALSFVAWFARVTGRVLPRWLGFAALVPAWIYALARRRRTPAAAAAGVALTALAFFSFGMQAFLNHYALALAGMWWAVAVAASPVPVTPPQARAQLAPSP
jgi:hypothetical protein